MSTWQPRPGTDQPRVKPLYPTQAEAERRSKEFWDTLDREGIQPDPNAAFNYLHPRDSRGRFMRKLHVAPMVDVFASPGMEDRVHNLFSNLSRAGIDVGKIDDKHQLPRFESVKDITANGQYNHRTNTIKLNDGFVDTDFGDMVMAHEFGHFLDYKIFSDDPLQSGAATHKVENANDEYAWLIASINMSAAAKDLLKKYERDEAEERRLSASASDSVTAAGRNYASRKLGYLQQVDKKFLGYLLQPTELFARAFMQYVIKRANPSLFERNYSDERLMRTPFERQWQSTDFQRIDLALTQTLQGGGWLKNS